MVQWFIWCNGLYVIVICSVMLVYRGADMQDKDRVSSPARLISGRQEVDDYHFPLLVFPQSSHISDARGEQRLRLRRSSD